MKSVLLLTLLLLGAHTYAQDSTKLKLNDLKAQGAIQVTKEELQALLPNAKVKSMSGAGSTRYWENSLDGKLVASSDTRGQVETKPTKPMVNGALLTTAHFACSWNGKGQQNSGAGIFSELVTAILA